MATFALISEGVTDQIILERIIEQICGKMFDDGIDVNPLQPLRDATDAHSAPYGGWELVLEFCEESATDALAANDYIVIHLDTDQGDHPNFGLPLTHNGTDQPYSALVAGAIEIITARLNRTLYRAHSERFLFAISVHSMESWLLLCLFNCDEPKNSMMRLNRLLRKNNRGVLIKEARGYAVIAREIKRKTLIALNTGNSSLSSFIAQLIEIRNNGTDEI